MRKISCLGMMKFTSLFIALPLSLLYTGIVQANDDLMFLDENVPVVLTATRLEQAQADVPASVTVITGQMLEDMGVRELAEALLLVPGMMVARENQRVTPIVQYHGGPHSSPRNLQVLINGRSMYRSSIASVVWSQLPVAIEDIERIEVVRGPNAASYGANAYQAVVNIITYHPSDTYGSRLGFRQGDNDVKDAYFRQGGEVAGADYRVSLFSRRWGGFQDDAFKDKRRSIYLDTDLRKEIDDTSSLTLQWSMGETFKQIPDDIEDNFSVEEHREVDNKSMDISLKWEKDVNENHKIHVQSYYTHSNDKEDGSVCNVPNILVDEDLFELYSLSPDAVNTVLGGALPAAGNARITQLATDIATRYGAGTTNFCGEVNEDIQEKRFDIEVQDTMVFNDDLTVVAGASFRRDVADSETRFGGEVDNEVWRLFGSASWQLNSSWLLHGGLMVEKESLLDVVASPRVAVNYHIDPWQTVRAVYSEAVRSPDLFESQANWTYTVRNVSPSGVTNGDVFFQSALGNPDLKPEHIASSEVGYFGRFMQLNAELDVRVFHESLTDVMDQNLQLGDFRSENALSMTFKGIEWQLSARPFDGTSLHWVAAWVDASADKDAEDVYSRLWAEKSTSFVWNQQWPKRFSTSVAYYLADSYNAKDKPEDVTKVERIDGKIGRVISLGPDSSISLSANVQHDIGSKTILFKDHFYEDDTRFYVSADLRF